MGFRLNPLTGQFDLVGSGGGAASNSFTTIQTPSGTSPVATSPTDTLTLAAGTDITITGNSGTDTVTIGLSTSLSGFVPYTGATANLNLGLFNIVDNANVDSIDPDVRSLHNALGDKTANWDTGELLATPTSVSLDWIDRKLIESANSYTVFDWQQGYLYNPADGQDVIDLQTKTLRLGSTTILDWSNQVIYDGAGVKAIDFSGSYRQLFDFGGSYPSVDFGNYGLYNIGISNSVYLLSWGVGDGGSVKIYNGYSSSVVGDFTNHQLSISSGGVTVDWGLRALYDNTSSVSIDWDYHYLQYMGITHVDWQNKYLIHDGGGGPVNSMEWGNFKLNNSGGFTSIDYGNYQLYDIAGFGTVASIDYNIRTLYASDGTTPVLNWSTQQNTGVTGASLTGGGGTTLTDTDTFDGYTVAQIVGALRAYGLLA